MRGEHSASSDRIDSASKLNQYSVTGRLEAPAMSGDCGIDAVSQLLIVGNPNS